MRLLVDDLGQDVQAKFARDAGLIRSALLERLWLRALQSDELEPRTHGALADELIYREDTGKSPKSRLPGEASVLLIRPRSTS